MPNESNLTPGPVGTADLRGITPGPWEIHETDAITSPTYEIHPDEDCDGLITIADVYRESDARAIAALPDLLAEIERLRAEGARALAELDSFPQRLEHTLPDCVCAAARILRAALAGQQKGGGA